MILSVIVLLFWLEKLSYRKSNKIVTFSVTKSLHQSLLMILSVFDNDTVLLFGKINLVTEKGTKCFRKWHLTSTNDPFKRTFRVELKDKYYFECNLFYWLLQVQHFLLQLFSVFSLKLFGKKNFFYNNILNCQHYAERKKRNLKHFFKAQRKKVSKLYQFFKNIINLKVLQLKYLDNF